MTVVETDRLVVPVRTATLLDLLDPFNCTPWDGMPVFTVDSVRAMVAAGCLHPDRIVDHHGVQAATHLARIAWLVVNWANDGTDPPDVEVFPGRWGSVIVHDGYHRICAAAARGDAHVHVEVSGDLDLAEDLFDITIP